MYCRHCGKEGEPVVCRACLATGHIDSTYPVLECPACLSRQAKLCRDAGVTFIGGAFVWRAAQGR